MENPIDHTYNDRMKAYEDRMQGKWAAAWERTQKETVTIISHITTSETLSPIDLGDYASDARKLIADMFIFTREGTSDPAKVSASPSPQWLRTRELAQELSVAIDRAWQFDKAS